VRHLKTEWKIFWNHFGQAPGRLKAFIYFCLVVTLFSLLAQFVFPIDIKEAVIPVTGWLLGGLYLNGLLIGLAPMFRNEWSFRLTPFHILHFFLFFSILLGAYDHYTYTGEFEDNPYLYHSPWRPVWTMGVPVFWMAVLLSPKVKSYYRFLTSKESDQHDRHNPSRPRSSFGSEA